MTRMGIAFMSKLDDALTGFACGLIVGGMITLICMVVVL